MGIIKWGDIVFLKLPRKFDITDLVPILFFKKLETEEIDDEGRS